MTAPSSFDVLSHSVVNSAGVPPPASQPSSANRALISGARTILVTSAAILSTIAFGVAAGTNKANQLLTSTFGKPASVNVGTSGTLEFRFVPVTASARNWPDVTSGFAE